MKVTEFDIKINKRNVLMLMDCRSDSPAYDMVLQEYEEILLEIYGKLLPAAVLEFGDFMEYELTEYGDGTRQALICIETVGQEISRWVTELFEEGNYLKGMLVNAMTDDYLFQMDNLLAQAAAEMCKKENYGIIRRLEAPQDIPMEVQKTAWEITNAKNEIGVEILDSYMFNPVKSNCQIYILKKNSNEYRTGHDCGKCPRTDCKLRNSSSFPVTVRQGKTELVAEGKKNQTLLEILQNAGIYLSAVCAGRGICGKCKIRVLEGERKPSAKEAAFFCKEELDKGYRLACMTIPDEACVIDILEEEKGFAIIADTGLAGMEDIRISEGRTALEKNLGHEKKCCAIAADIGTTTIVMQLLELEEGVAADTYTTINRQRAYGADVISRIQASNEGKKEVLQQSVCEDLIQGLDKFLAYENVQIEEMVISGNTTMVHLLMRYSCEGLGVYPFTPVHIETIHAEGRELFGDEKYDFPIKVLPGISAYIGGDVTAGLLACGFNRNEKASVLLDLGTNGEMAVGCKDRILTASAAAGPAFEGGNIVCGMGSVPGAISRATYGETGFQIETIANRKPEGICGTGAIDIVYELLDKGFIDETGLLNEAYSENGILIAENSGKEIRFYQKDIREMQLAKAAIRAGLETLLVSYGVTCEEIDTVYIAGGFGYKTDIEKAIGIGLLPEECKGKVKAVGNTSLSGSILYLVSEDAADSINEIVSRAEEIQLAGNREFHDFYMQYMYF